MNDGWTLGSPTDGVVLHQPARGFRYGAEAFWLVGAALEEPVRTALDLGTGSGIIAWLLAARGVEVVALDSAEAWSEGWRRTARDSVVPGRVELRRADVRHDDGPAVDVVLSNPPFFALGTGPRPGDPLADTARFELAGVLTDFLDAGARRVRPGGRVIVVVPREREAEVVAWGRVGVERWCRVGRRRTLFVLRGTGVVSPQDVGAEGVAAWYTGAGARGSG